MAVEKNFFIHQNVAREKSGQCRVLPEMSQHRSNGSEGAVRVLRVGSLGNDGWCGPAQSVLKRPSDGRPRWRSRGVLPPLGAVESRNHLLLASDEPQLQREIHRRPVIRLANYTDDSKGSPFAGNHFAPHATGSAALLSPIAQAPVGSDIDRRLVLYRAGLCFRQRLQTYITSSFK